jgi:hypothetical protein
MDKSLAPADVARPAQIDNLRGLIIGAVLLPAAISVVDYAVLARFSAVQEKTLETCVQFGWYVVQVGVIGHVVGRSITQPLYRWVVFGWVLLLINLLTYALSVQTGTYEPRSAMPPAAMFSGQIGLCIAWAFFGDTRWPIRWPSMILLAAGVFGIWSFSGNEYSRRIWTELLVLQVLTLATLCSLLRLRGFQLMQVRDDSNAGFEAQLAQRPVLQFNIKHVLMWTTSLAVILGIAKALNWQAALEMMQGGIAWKLILATASAIVIIVALWVALGRGHWLVRYAFGLLFTLLSGSGLALWSIHNAAISNSTLVTGRRTSITWELLRLYEIGWWWLGWLFLTGGLLAATLLILRVLDYGLVKVTKAKSP